jgi:hypothetical protein
VPFDPDHFREQLANASHEILLDMSTALALREEAIQKHSGLIQQLEDDTLCKPVNCLVLFRGDGIGRPPTLTNSDFHI